MTPDVWRQVEEVYNSLADLDPATWPSELAGIGDAAIREEVRQLLDAGPIPTEFGGAVRSLAREASLAHLRFGPWRAVKIIGHGGMGAVYEAVRDDGSFAQKAAVKILQTGIDQPAARERFIQEREILASLNHPNIAHLIDGGETASGVSYIVMEFVDGEPVTQWCASRKPSREQILRLFLKICAAVEYAHHHLVVHRDLKPANILVTPDGIPKLLDFGIAKLLDSSGSVTRTGFHPLTPAYASPEQFLGRPITTATDVYSLGVVLYEMLTGRAPFPMPSTSSPVAITRAVCESDPEPPGIAADLDNILLMALRKEPERRYASIATFAADVENFLATRPISAREDSLWYRSTRFVQRHAGVVAATSVIFLVLAGGIVASQYQARRAQRHFEETRVLANEVLQIIDKQLTEIPATVEARQQLINTVLQHLERLSRDTGGDAALESELTVAYQRAGALLGSIPSGDPLYSLNRATEIGERLRSRGTADLRVLDALANAYYGLASLYYDLGRRDLSRRNCQLAIECARDPRFTRGAAFVTSTAHRFMGRMQIDAGELAAALQSMEAAIAAAEQAVWEERTPRTVQELNVARFYLARVVILRADLPRLGEVASAALADGLQINTANPRSSEAKLALLTAYLVGTGGAVPRDMYAHFLKRESVEAAIALAKQMAAQEPAIRRWWTWLLLGYIQLSNASTDLGEATEAARTALALAERLAGENPNSKITARNVIFSRMLLADCLRRAGDQVGASEQATLAIHALNLGFTDRESKADTLQASLILANIHEKAGDKARAAERFEASRKIAETLAAQDPADMRMAAFLSLTYEGLGRCGPKAAAADWFSKSIALWKSWPTRTRSSGYDQEHLQEAERLLKAVK